MVACTEGKLIFVVTTLLSSALGAPILDVVANPTNYGSTETLRCTDATYTSGENYVWDKDGAQIFDNSGEISTNGKYSESINGTTFKLVINNIDASDEGSYTCNHNFTDSNILDLEVESRGNVTAELLSSKYLEVTFQQIYPHTENTTITCDSTTVVGHFKSSVADGDRYINTWLSNDTFTTKPTSCSASLTLRTTFNTAFTVISVPEAPTTEVYVCFWRKSLDSCWKCWFCLVLLILALLVVVVVVIGIVVEARFKILELLSFGLQIVLYALLLFGLGLYLYDYIKKLLDGKPASPVITSQSNSPYPTSILVKWKKPSDRGYAIQSYKITYQKVEFRCICCRNKIDEVEEIEDIKETSFTINNLSPGTYYEVKVYAINEKGSSSPGQKDFLTRSQDDGKSWAFCCCCLARACCLAGACCEAVVCSEAGALLRNGKRDKEDTSRDVESTSSSPKNANSKLLNKDKQNSATGKAEGMNKGKHVSDTQIHPDDKVHSENEGKSFRPQPPLPPSGANINQSQLPNIPGHDKKGRGLSSNFEDDDHPLVDIDIPAQKAGALPTITDTPRETKKKTKKKKKDKQEDNQKTETVLDF